MLQLRYYQTNGVTRLREAFRRGRRRIILRAPTGAGKTVIGCALIEGAIARGGRVLWLAHRTELIQQVSRKLSESGVFHGIVRSGIPATVTAPVQVASVQSLRSRSILEPTVIVVDEAHHTNAATYLEILRRYPDAAVIGLTATPARTDGRGLGEVFEEIIETVDYWELLDQGFLVPMRLVEPFIPDMKGVRTTGGDYNGKDKEALMRKSKLYGDVVATWLKYAAGRPTLLFASSIGHSMDLCTAFRAAGVVAEHVDGNTEEGRRSRLFGDIQNGRIDVLSNVGVATEGTDLPAVSCIVLTNPTKSIILHHQMIGRGLRTFPGKDDCMIIDHAGNHHRNGSIADEVEWTLEGKVKRKATSGEGSAQPVRMCPKCFLAMKGGTPTCPACGHEFVVQGRRPEVHAAEMRETSPQRVYKTKTDPLTFYVRKLLQGKEKGYRPTWAKLQFKLVFGDWPAFSWKEIDRKEKEIA